MFNTLSRQITLAIASTAIVTTTLPTRTIADSPNTAAPIAVQVNWQQPTGITTTSMSYGMNVFQAFDPKVAGPDGNRVYQANVASMRPGMIRYHNMQMLQDSKKDPSGWVINPHKSDYRWDRAKIAQAMSGAYSFKPTVMMNIPGWTSFLDRNGRLRPDRYKEFAKFCADLVRIVNVENKAGVRYWEILNEKDEAYPNDMQEVGRIYTMAAREMKRVDPSIRVGGPAFISPYDTVKVSAFLTTARASLDFVSYHTYSFGKEVVPVDQIWDSASSLGDASYVMRQSLTKFNKQSIEMFHSEFNISYTPPDDRMTNEVSAIYDALALVAIANSGVTGSMAWNESDGWYGKLENQWGGWQKRPAAFVHQLFNSQMQGRVVRSVSSQPKAVTSFAVTGSGRQSIALINRSGKDQRVNLQSTGSNLAVGKLFTAYQVDKSGMTTTAIAQNQLSNYRLPANTVTIMTANP